jgi:hypothetical protein
MDSLRRLRTIACAPVVGLVWAAVAGDPLPCREARIESPASRSTVTESQPTVRWEPLPGAMNYRVEIESRVPEGRVLVAIDTMVEGTSFRPPRPLTDFRGAVKLRISAGCPVDDGSALREKGAWFLIDTSPLCSLAGPLALSPDGLWLEWKPVAAAVRYDVSLRETNGDPRSEGQTKEPRYALPAESRPFVAIVRPYCPTGFGRWASVLVSP